MVGARGCDVGCSAPGRQGRDVRIRVTQPPPIIRVASLYFLRVWCPGSGDVRADVTYRRFTVSESRPRVSCVFVCTKRVDRTQRAGHSDRANRCIDAKDTHDMSVSRV